MDRTKIGSGWQNKLKKLLKSYWVEIIGILLLLTICVIYALYSGHYADFFPINGTFQNFNPVRRLLAGQVPYGDFTDYLGFGHLYLGTITTVIFGSDYQGSMIAFSFLTILGLASLSLMVSKALFKENKVAIYMTNLILLMLIIKPLFFVYGLGLTNDIIYSLNYALDTGNSARFVRGFILPLSVGLFYLLVGIYEKNFFREKKEIVIRWLPSLGVGALAGFSFVWSNDYGICCWLCILLMVFWVSISKKRKFFKAVADTGVALLSSLISIFIFVEILTLGHFASWFKSMFGTGGYQSWYYNSYKSNYFFEVDFSYIMLIQALIALTYLIFLFRKKATKEAIYRYGVPGFANMVCFCAVNEYKLLSGNTSREVALSVLFLIVVFESIHLFGKACQNSRFKQGLIIVSLIVGLSWCISTAKDESLFYLNSQKEGKYVASMGGYMTSLYTDLEATNQFLCGEDFWSTYASAQEVMEDKFQPSGTDYIIHVLGDEKREDYLSAFINGDFKYVATIRKSFTDWEYWAERANWFFYREIYQNWHPVFENTYAIYWEKNKVEDEYSLSNEYNVDIQVIDGSTVKLKIQTDDSINGIADVYIDYSVDKKQESKLELLLFQRMLMVENTGIVSASDSYYESNYLRSESAEYIPMTITNGYGELTLTATPDRSVNLNLKKVSCKKIYTVMAEE